MDPPVAIELISEPQKLGVMFIILFVSLFAVSFPPLSKQIPFLRIPGTVFFIGKHFGTGVILATAFIHLLDDAFSSLKSPIVEKRYHHLGKWTGSIILASLLTIFLIEYISTSFVEHLHNRPSAPSTPIVSPPPSRSRSAPPAKAPSEVTPLLAREDLPIVVVPIEVITNSPRICRLAIAHDHVHEHHPHTHLSEEEHVHVHEHAHPRIGRQRQIVGILVLQLGIMIHSLVIGMTLALTTGAEFTSLTTAVIFHQLFEGFSLGIRIAAVPDKAERPHQDDADARLAVAVEEALRRPSTSDLEASSSSKRKPPGMHWLKPTLSFLFGVTTPAGMALGMTLWPTSATGRGGAKMMLVQGVMSAISAGMLIYAATVEMLAGDFVFGDVEGGHHHHHHAHDAGEDDLFGHQHAPPQRDADDAQNGQRIKDRGRTENGSSSGQGSTCPLPSPPCENGNGQPNGDSSSTGGSSLKAAGPASPVAEDRPSAAHPPDGKKSSMGKRVVAVISLLAGVSMMVLVGLGE